MANGHWRVQQAVESACFTGARQQLFN